VFEIYKCNIYNIHVYIYKVNTISGTLQKHTLYNTIFTSVHLIYIHNPKANMADCTIMSDMIHNYQDKFELMSGYTMYTNSGPTLQTGFGVLKKGSLPKVTLV